jgi:hypothetical protein
MEATLAIAIAGLTLGVVSLGWQVWTHLTNGPRVRVEGSNSIVPEAQKPYDWLVCVTAVNTGRAATTIANWGFRVPDGGNLQQFERIPWSAALPHRLEPQSSVGFLMPVAGMRQACAERGIAVSSLRAWVRLGTGKEITGGPPKVRDD